MPRNLAFDDEAISRFWDRFLQSVHNQSIGPPLDRWYVIRAEQYVKAFPDRRLVDHSQCDLEEYLRSLGRMKDLKDWQFKQSVDSIRILLQEIVSPPWFNEVDWDYWEQSARGLSANHSTVARDYQAPPTNHPKHTTPGSSLSLIREKHAKVLADLVG